MIAIALTHLCFGGDSPLVVSYVQNKVLLILGGATTDFKQNDSTKPNYNLEGVFPIYL